MSDEPSAPQPTPTNYQRTTGGHLRWEPPTPEHLHEMLPSYEILSILGQGGMGAVYKGRQKSLDRLVAIKILPPEAAENDMQFVERFKNEARTMAKMNHPAIVHVYDFGETTEGQLYIVMEFIDGTDVAQMIRSQGKLSQEYALSITAHVCDALQYAHTHGVVHRDIKPANVLINQEGQVKVADFGLAKATDPSQMGLTKTNMAMGTPDFVSPEALMPGVPLDGRADLYAVGVMLFNMLTGTIPRGAFRMPGATLNTDARFDDIIGKAMQMDREMRYQSALDLRRDLDVILTRPMAKAALPAAQQQQPQTPAQAQKPMGRAPGAPQQQQRKEPGSASTPVPAAAPKRKSNAGVIYGIAAGVVVSAVAVVMLSGGEKKPPAKPQATVNAGEKSRPEPRPQPQPGPATPSPAPPPASAAAKSSDVFIFGGHRYQLVRTGLITWETAKSKALGQGGHLVTITSKAEHEALIDHFKEGWTTAFHLWIGLTRAANSSEWKWVTGETFSFKGWAQGQPDVQRTLPAFADYWARDARVAGWGWDDTPGNNTPREGYIIEWDDDGRPKPAPAPAPAVVPAPALASIPPAPAPTPAMPAAATPTPAVPPAPAVPADPRLAQLEAGFNARYESDAQKPYLASLAALNQSYVANGISRMRSAAQQKGALEEVTTLDAEKTRIEKGESLPPADMETLPDSLKSLRATYRTALAKIEAERAQKAAPLYDLYLRALDTYVTELTRSNKLDEAKGVKTLRDEIAARKTAGDAGTATPQADTTPSSTKPASVSEAESGTGRSSRWYDAARWVVSKGGVVRVEKNGQGSEVRSEADIPSGKFAITAVTIQPNSKAVDIRDDDFTRFSGLKELTSILLDNVKVTDAAFAFLPTTPALASLTLHKVPVTDVLLTHLAPLKSLNTLQVQWAPGFTGAGLERLASLPLLKNVWYTNNGVNSAGLKALLGARNLEVLRLEAALITDADLSTLSVLPKLRQLCVTLCKDVRGTSLDSLASLIPSLRILEISNCPLDASAFRVIGKYVNLTDLKLNDLPALNDDGLAALAPLTKVNTLGIARSRVTGSGFAALNRWTELRQISTHSSPITAEGITLLAASCPQLTDLRLSMGARLESGQFGVFTAFKSLTHLELPLVAVNDADLADIARLPTLESLLFAYSSITAKGLGELKALKYLTGLAISECKGVDDSAIAVLKTFKALKTLEIKGTAISPGGVGELKKALPQCNVVH